MFKLVVLSALLALACAKPSLTYSSLVAPAVYSTPLASVYSNPFVSAYSSPLVSAYPTPLVPAYHGVSEVGLDRHTPAVINKATGVPLETIDVINARNAHYTAKSLNAHGIFKRSIAYTPLITPSVYAAPTAVSHQSRVDVHSSPALAYSAPFVHGIYKRSIAYSAPVVTAYSHPLVSAYATPVVPAYSSPLVSAYSTPLSSAYHGFPEVGLDRHTPAVINKATGVPLETVDVINARNAHYTAKTLNAHGIYKRSIAYSTPVTAYSHPLVSAYSTPIVSAYSSPLVSAYTTPVVSAYSTPLVPAYHGVPEVGLDRHTPAVINKATGVPLETVDVINARNAHYTAKSLNAHGIFKRSIAYSPLITPSVYAAPTAISHQSRVDVHSSPALAYSAPVVSAYSSPLVSAYTTPVVSAYSSPLVSAYSTPVVSAYHGVPEVGLDRHTPAVINKATGVPLETVDVINARNAHYTAKALNAHGIHKRSIAYSTPVISSAYSHPLVSAYSAPVVSAYSTPAVSAYSAPLVSGYSTSVVNSHAAPAYSVHPW